MSTDDDAILVGLGGNLAGPDGEPPNVTIERALDRLRKKDIRSVEISRWYRTRPVPISDQPWYWNAVARIEHASGPESLLAALHGLEATTGRIRRTRNEARTIDLDLLAYGRETRTAGGAGLTLPHPRMGDRAFVLAPLLDVAPAWRHPSEGWSAADRLASLEQKAGEEGLGIRLAET